jgi:hypothetical protein
LLDACYYYEGEISSAEEIKLSAYLDEKTGTESFYVYIVKDSLDLSATRQRVFTAEAFNNVYASYAVDIPEDLPKARIMTPEGDVVFCSPIISIEGELAVVTGDQEVHYLLDYLEESGIDPNEEPLVAFSLINRRIGFFLPLEIPEPI